MKAINRVKEVANNPKVKKFARHVAFSLAVSLTASAIKVGIGAGIDYAANRIATADSEE